MAATNVKRKDAEVSQVETVPEERMQKNLACIQLLNEWLADESGYDEEAWPKLKQLLEGSLSEKIARHENCCTVQTN